MVKIVDFRVEGSASLDPAQIITDVDEIIKKLDELKDKVDETDLKLDELAHKQVDIEVLVNGEDKLTELRAVIDELDTKTHTLTVGVEIRDYDKLLLLRSSLDEMDAADHTAKIDIEIHGEEELDILRGQLFDLRDGEHTVTVNVDIEGFDGVMAKLVALDEELKRKKDDLGNLTKGLDDTSKSADKNSNSANKLKFSWLMLAPALIPLLPLVSILAGGILGLASAFFTMSVPLAGLAFSVKGFLSDFSNVESGLSQQAQTALDAANSYQDIYNVLQANSAAFQQMDPLEQAAAVNYEQLKHALSDFQSAVEPAVLPMLVQGFTLIEQVLGYLAPMVSTAATAVGKFLGDFANRLRDPVFQKFFTDVEKNLGTFVTDWLTGFLNIFEGFTALMDAFMPLGLKMSGGFVSMTQSFDTWAQHLSQSKGFHDFVAFVEKEGPILLNVLGQVVILIGHLFTAIGSNAAAGGLLTTLDHILKTLNGFMSAHPGMSHIVADLTLMGVAAWKLAPALGPIISFLSTPVGAVAGAIVAVGAAFFYAYTHVKTFHDWVDKNLGPMWTGLVKDAQQFVDFFKKMWPDLEQVWKTYGGHIENIIKDDFGFVITFLENAMKILEGIFEIADGILTGNWSKIWDGIKKIFEGFFGDIFAYAKMIFNNFINAVEAFGRMLWDLFKTPLDAIGRYFRSTWDSAVAGVEAFFDQILRDVQGWGSSFFNAIGRWVDQAGTWFSNLPGNIQKWLGNLSLLLWNAGVQIIDGLVSGVKSRVESALKPVMNWVTGLIHDLKGPPSKDKVLLYSNGQLIINGLINGMESLYPKLSSSLGGLTKNIENTFGKQYSASISARINTAVQDANFAVRAYGQGGQLPSQPSGAQVNFAAGSIVVNNPKQEQPGITLTRVLQGAAKFGTIQAPVGYSTSG